MANRWVCFSWTGAPWCAARAAAARVGHWNACHRARAPPALTCSRLSPKAVWDLTAPRGALAIVDMRSTFASKHRVIGALRRKLFVPSWSGAIGRTLRSGTIVAFRETLASHLVGRRLRDDSGISRFMSVDYQARAIAVSLSRSMVGSIAG